MSCCCTFGLFSIFHILPGAGMESLSGLRGSLRPSRGTCFQGRSDPASRGPPRSSRRSVASGAAWSPRHRLAGDSFSLRLLESDSIPSAPPFSHLRRGASSPSAHIIASSEQGKRPAWCPGVTGARFSDSLTEVSVRSSLPEKWGREQRQLTGGTRQPTSRT